MKNTRNVFWQAQEAQWWARERFGGLPVFRWVAFSLKDPIR